MLPSEKIETLSAPAPPDVETVYGSLGKYPSSFHALSELIDNSGEYGPTSTINVDINNDTIFIRDDGRGLDSDSMTQMFRIKRTSHEKGETGFYGYGFKCSYSYLARHCRVLSKKDGMLTWGDPEPTAEWRFPIMCPDLDSEEYEKKEAIWNRYFAGNGESGTIIVLKDLKDSFDKKQIKNLKNFLSTRYHDVFKKKEIKIILNGEEIEYEDIRGSTFEYGLDKKEFVYVDKEGKEHPFKLSTYLHEKGNQANGVCWKRNGRLICEKAKLGFPMISQTSMASFQIVIESDNCLDDLLKMAPTKILDKEQVIDRNFKLFLLNETGLKSIINKVHDSLSEKKKEKNDLSHWQDYLNYLSRFVLKYPEPLHHVKSVSDKSNLNDSEEPTPRAPKQNKGESHAGRKKLNSSLDQYKGACNLDLRPLGADGLEWEIEDRHVKGKSQIVLVFNEDVPHVKELIGTSPLTGAAKKYVSDVLSKVLVIRSAKLSDSELMEYNRITSLISSNRTFTGQNLSEINSLQGK